MKESKYLEYFKAGHTGKTEVHDVLSKSSGAILGHIKWYGPWRQYCFWPCPQTIFNPDCLNHINGFIAELMAERKRMKDRSGQADVCDVRRCRVCGCTDDDCHQCIEKTGQPCHRVEDDLCSACVTADDGTKKPRLFYFEEGVDAWIPAPDNRENIVDLDIFSGSGEIIEIQFKRIDMTDTEFNNLPEC